MSRFNSKKHNLDFLFSMIEFIILVSLLTFYLGLHSRMKYDAIFFLRSSKSWFRSSQLHLVGQGLAVVVYKVLSLGLGKERVG